MKFETKQLSDGKLTTQMIDQYKSDGFLYPIKILEIEEACTLRKELELIEEKYSKIELPKPIDAYKRGPANAVIPLVANIAKDDRILDIVESIIGTNILVWAAEFFIKEKKSDNIVEMHQDLTYWGMGETSAQVTAWLALSPSNKESGCMEFVKGSHKNKILPHNNTYSSKSLLSRGQEVQVAIANDQRILAELQPGQMSIHHGLMIHGSGPNLSNDRRIGVAIRYINPDVVQNTSKSYAMPVRGIDNRGNFIHYSAPKEIFSKESLKLHKEICESQQKIFKDEKIN